VDAAWLGLASTTDTHGGGQMEKAGERAAAPAREKRAAGMEQVMSRPGLACLDQRQEGVADLARTCTRHHSWSIQ
jgi:hypothetical protein